MGRLFHIWYAVLLIGVWALFTVGRVNDGNVLIMSFQGDALHMVQTVLRMAAGEIPHRDFQTPLGAMAFMPISSLVKLGFGIGKAFAYAPSVLALIALPAVYWIGLTRYSNKAALLFGFVFLSMMFAFIHGGLVPSVTASMYYNNWSWAAGMLVVSVVLLPGPDSRAGFWIDAVILGVGMGFLTLTKATYAVFLLPGIVLALSMDRAWAKMSAGIVVAVVFLAVFTLPLGGVAYWLGYIGDLKAVALSETRPQPGLGLNELALSARHLPGGLALLAAVIFLRQARLLKEGLVLLVLGLGWTMITYQNWENDPHWMVLAGLLLFPMARKTDLYNGIGWPLRPAIQMTGVALLVLGLPLTLTQVQSVVLHNGLKAEAFTQTLPINRQADLRFRSPKDGVIWVKTPRQDFIETAAKNKPALLGQEVLPACSKENGLVADMIATGEVLDGMTGTAGKTAVYADWVNAIWLFSNLEPLRGGAPWYYGGTPGFANADFLVVPLCPMGPSVRRIMLEQIAADPELRFEEVQRNDLFILLRRSEI